jgi:hypothetical protein
MAPLRERHHRTLNQPARAIRPLIPALVNVSKCGQALRILQNLFRQLLHGLNRSVVG